MTESKLRNEILPDETQAYYIDILKRVNITF